MSYEEHQQVLTACAEAFIAFIEETHPGHHLGVVSIIAELRTPDDDASFPVSYCSDPRRWVQAGLYQAMAKAVVEPPVPEQPL